MWTLLSPRIFRLLLSIEHAARETTTVYTGVTQFSDVAEELSTGASSLLEDVDRPAVVIEFVVNARRRRSMPATFIGPSFAIRHNSPTTRSEPGSKAKVAAPPKVAASAELQAQLKLQDEAAQALKKLRFEHGALNIDTAEVHSAGAQPAR